MISENLSGTLGQQVIVENRPGAGGNIATEAAMRSSPDGYTMNPILFGKAIYDPIKDFTPISLVGSQRFVLSVHSSVPARSVKELIGHAKASPGKMSYASSGPGSPQDLSMALFKQAAGLNIVHVPCKGASLFVADLVNGTVQVALASLTVAGQPIKAGEIVSLELTSKQRSSLMAGVPTVA